MINTLSYVKERWEQENTSYMKFSEYIHSDILSALIEKGIYCKVTYRVKEMASILKKVIRKNYDTPYEKIVDKAGVRIIVHFPWQMQKVEQVIYSRYTVLDKDDKASALKINELGYQAIHYQIELSESKLGDIPKGFEGKSCEVQLRTVCQDVWSEMAHILAYKSEQELPNSILREIHCLSALLELTDKSFSQIDNMIRELPNTYSINLLNKLESYFYSLIDVYYDKELSIEIIEHLKLLYTEDDLLAFQEIMNKFVSNNLPKLQYTISKYRSKILFMSQPEIFIILERLDADRYSLQDLWEKTFPVEELQYIATAWGSPFD